MYEEALDLVHFLVMKEKYLMVDGLKEQRGASEAYQASSESTNKTATHFSSRHTRLLRTIQYDDVMSTSFLLLLEQYDTIYNMIVLLLDNLHAVYYFNLRNTSSTTVPTPTVQFMVTIGCNRAFSMHFKPFNYNNNKICVITVNSLIM